jgi:flavodoxin
MKFAVRYQSRGGNTRAVAEIIAGIVGVKEETIDIPLDETIDILFIGGGVYGGRIDKKLKDYIENMYSEKIGEIIPFGTSIRKPIVINEITEYAVKKGIKVDERKLHVQMRLKGFGMLGLKGGKLNDKQIGQIKEFTNEIMQNI